MVELVGEVGVLLLDDGLHALPRDLGAVDVGLEVPQVGARPVLLLAGHLAGRDLLEQAARAVGDRVDGVGQLLHARVELLGVGEQVVGVGRALLVGERRVVLGALRPEVLLDEVPAGPLLAGLEVGLAGVHHRVEVAEGLGDRLDALPVGARDRVERAGRVVVAGLVEVDELLGLLQQLGGLVLDVRRVVGLGLVDELLLVGGDLDLLVGLGDGELAADALAGHARLAGGDVRPRRAR